jgi:hypothetical protein
LKPEFFNDKKIGMLGANPALVFEALWCMADDGGTALCNPELVKGQMFSFWPAMGLPEISEALERLAVAERIERYSIGDDEYAAILHFKEHQPVHKPSLFRHPRPPQAVTVSEDDRLRHQCGTGSVNGSTPRVLKSSTPQHPYTPEFLETRKAYPKRAGGDSEADAWKQYQARIRSGETSEVIHAGTLRYAAYIRATGKEKTEYVKQMCTFLGKSRHYLEPWDIPASNGSHRAADENVKRGYMP